MTTAGPEVQPPLTGFGARIPQTVRYLAVGGFNTAFSLAVFAGLNLVMPYLLALVVTHVITVAEAFVLQRYIVFHVRGHVLIDLARFESVYLGAFLLNIPALALLVSVVGLPAVPAQAICLAVTAVGTYLLHKHFSFRR